MKTELSPYTKKETNAIYDLWYTKKSTRKERTDYAISIGRTFTQCSSKASYEKKKRMEGNTRRQYKEPFLERHAAEVSITKVIKAPVRNAIINVGVATIEIPSKTFYVNGIKIDW